MMRIFSFCLLSAAATAALASPTLAYNKCDQGTETWVQVEVSGFRDRDGQVAVELHPAQEGDYMDHTFTRQIFKTPDEGNPSACLPVSSAGDYIIVVLHDRNSDRKLDVFSDGFGFSNNPEIGMGLPEYQEVSTKLNPGQNDVSVVLNYVQGLTARPIDEELQQKVSRRRRLRHR